MSRETVLDEIHAERNRQESKFPDQHLPNGTGPYVLLGAADRETAAKFRTELAIGRGTLTWEHVLSEEYFEALAARSDEDLRAELVQVAAVAVRWIEDLDRSGS